MLNTNGKQMETCALSSFDKLDLRIDLTSSTNQHVQKYANIVGNWIQIVLVTNLPYLPLRGSLSLSQHKLSNPWFVATAHDAEATELKLPQPTTFINSSPPRAYHWNNQRSLAVPSSNRFEMSQ